MMQRIWYILAIVLISVSAITFFSLFGTAYGEFKVEKENYDISYSGITQVKLFGTLEDSDSLRNKITFAITNPEGDSEEISVIPTNRGYFENYLIFDRNSLLGIYEVIAFTHDGRTIGKVSFELNGKKKYVDVVPKQPESFVTKQPEVSSQNLTAKETKQSIPSWIKNTAGFWADNQISDTEFLNGIEFLIGQEIIQIPKAVAQIEKTPTPPTKFYVVKKEVSSETDSRWIYNSRLYCDEGDTAISGGYVVNTWDISIATSHPISSTGSSYDGWQFGFNVASSVGRQLGTLFLTCANTNP